MTDFAALLPLVAILAQRGVAYLRVHDVEATMDALAVVAAMGLGNDGPRDH